MRRWWLVSLALVGLSATAQDVATVEWLHPQQYTDGTPLDLNDIAATELHYGLCPLDTGEFQSLEVDAPTEYVVRVTLPVPGLWCFRGRTRLHSLEWSAWTDVVTLTLPLPPYTGTTLPPFQLVM